MKAHPPAIDADVLCHVKSTEQQPEASARLTKQEPTCWLSLLQGKEENIEPGIKS